MNYRKTALALIVVSSIVLSSCSRQAAASTLPTPTVVDSLPSSGSGQDDPMKLLQDFATQTALASTGGSQGGASATPDAQLTVVGGVSTNTPDPLLAGATTTVPNSGATSTATPSTGGLPSVTPATVVAVATSAPVAPGSRPATYTLQSGEYPYCIARRFNADPDELLTLNGISSTQTIFDPGLVLKIPQSSKPFPATRALKPHPTTYTVGGDESIYSIACKFGDVDPMAIASANGLTAPYTLKLGQVLNIP